MKKVIALALTLAMVLAIGVTAFAAPSLNYDKIEVEVEDTVTVAITDWETEGYTITSANGYVTVGTPKKVEGNGYVVDVTAKTVGIDVLKVVDEDDNVIDVVPVEVVKPEEEDPAENVKGELATTYSDEGANVTIDLTTKEVQIAGADTPDNETDDKYALVSYVGFKGDLYDKVVKLHPETITILGDNYSVVLYRGDYTTLNISSKKTIKITVDVVDKLYIKGKDVNNRVLKALGNTKADPFYVDVVSSGLDLLAEEPEFTINLNAAGFEQWVKTNDAEDMDVYTFDSSDDTVALVDSNVAINNRFDTELVFDSCETATYVLVDAGNSAGSGANTKPNASTGANDMVAVAVVFATIALAAGVAKAR